jgi:hypothetical protein
MTWQSRTRVQAMDKDVRRFMYVGLGTRKLLDRGVSLGTEHLEQVERLLVQHGIAPHRLLSSDEVTPVMCSALLNRLVGGSLSGNYAMHSVPSMQNFKRSELSRPRWVT